MKQTFKSSKHWRAVSGDISKLMPKAANKSEEPDLLETLRLPCLHTLTPQAAATNALAVEMLMVPRPSPPVPTISVKG